MDLEDSFHEVGIFPKSSPLSFSDFERNINQVTSKEEMYADLIASSDDEPSICLQSSDEGNTSKSSENTSNQTVEDTESISPVKSYNSDLKSFGGFSFEHTEVKPILSEEKIAELKALQSKVNEAYVDYRIKEFILDKITTKPTSWGAQIKMITKNSLIKDKVSLVCENGEATNILGLEEEDLKLNTNRSMAMINKSAFRDNCLRVIESNLAKLKLQKNSLQDKYGAHSMKTSVGLLTRERKEQLDLYRHVEQLQNEVRRLISVSTSIVQQLATLRQDSARHLQSATFELVQNKALYIKTVISSLNEQLEQSLLMDENTKRKMDAEGDNLKTQLTEMKEELKALQKTLKEYEKKEAESTNYKALIAEYGKLRKQLESKQETLKMLDEPNLSF